MCCGHCPDVLVPQGQAGPLQVTPHVGEHGPSGRCLQLSSNPGVCLGVTGDLVRKRRGDAGEDRNAGREAARLRVVGPQCVAVGSGEQGLGLGLCAELFVPQAAQAQIFRRRARLGKGSQVHSCVRAGAPSGWALAPAVLPASWIPGSCFLPAGRPGPGHPARPPVEVAPRSAPSTASGLTGLASRRPSRTLTVRVCLGSRRPHRLATCSAAQPGARSPGER